MPKHIDQGKGKTVKMVQAIALHDLSYLDHNGEPQYHRQGSKMIEIDKANYDFFLGRKAVRPFKDAVKEAPVADEFEEENFGGEAEVNSVSTVEPEVNPVKSNTLHLNKGHKK